MQLADVNGDGKLDAVVAGTDSTGQLGHPEFAIMLGHGDGTFDPPQTFSTAFDPASTAWWLGVGDLNDDGKADVVIANGDDQKVRVFLNTTPSKTGGGGGGTGGSGTGGGGAGGGGGTGANGVFQGLTLHPQTLTVLPKGTVKASLPCPPGSLGNCVGTAALRSIRAIAVRVRHKKLLTFGSARFSIPAGHAGTVKIRLSKLALRLLRKRHTLKALEVVIAHDSRGVSKASKTSVTLRSARARKR
jgi:hypothetical protein